MDSRPAVSPLRWRVYARSVGLFGCLVLLALLTLRFALLRVLLTVVDLERDPGWQNLASNVVQFLVLLVMPFAFLFVLSRLRQAGRWGEFALHSGRSTLWAAWALALLVSAGLVGAHYLTLCNGGSFENRHFIEVAPKVYFRTPGSLHVEERGRFRTVAHIGDDGLRVCGPPDGEPMGGDEVVVALVGDSFAFGQWLSDEETLCWKLREQFASNGRTTVRFINAALPGANWWSYPRTVRYVLENYDADLVLLGTLMPNDANPVDAMASLYLAHHSTLFQLAGAILSPDAVADGAFVLYERFAPNDWKSERFLAGVRELAAVAELFQRPVLLYSYYISADHDEMAREVAGHSPWLDYIGRIDVPDEGGFYMPADHHPTGKGNNLYLSVLEAHVRNATAPAAVARVRALPVNPAVRKRRHL